MSKTITAVFGNGIFTTTAKVFQWDAGDKLQFVGIDLPENYRVDFSNSLTGESKSVLGNSSGVVIPSEYFKPGRMIYAWVVIPENDGQFTKYQVNIPIYQRAEPTDDEPTPEQQSALNEAIAALNEAAEDIPEQIETALQEAKDSGEFDGEDGYSPVVTITQITGGHRVTITDEEHPHGQSFDVMDGQGGSGSSDYDDLSNKPQINSVTLSGNKSLSDLGIEAEALVVAITESNGAYTADKTASQILEASAAKKRVIATLGATMFQYFAQIGGKAYFTAIYNNASRLLAVAETKVATVSIITLGTYTKPSGGIPKTDLASDVQTSLGKADTALQTAQGVAHAGEFLVVGSDGNITTVTMSAWTGGSY